MAHGGPGAGHEYLLPFTELWTRYGIPLVFYDQIGCAASTRLPQTAGDESFWQPSLFVDELNNLLDHLQLRDGPGYHLYGQSWGARLAAEFAVNRPQGLRKVILASGASSTETSRAGYDLLLKELPLETQQAIEEALQKNEFDTPAYKQAMGTFFNKFLVRVRPSPPEAAEAMKHLGEDTTVRGTMLGPSLFNDSVSLHDWTIIPKLHQITAPTLVYRGEFDSSHELTTAPFVEHIPNSKKVVFADSAHMCHLEREDQREEVFRVVGEFLTGK